jgi:hypothetical protein
LALKAEIAADTYDVHASIFTEDIVRIVLGKAAAAPLSADRHASRKSRASWSPGRKRTNRRSTESTGSGGLDGTVA